VITLRPVAAGDLDPIMAIETASFPTDAWSAAMMRTTLADRDAVAVAAVDGETVVGYAAVLAPQGAGDADVLTIAVAGPARGQGTGRALLTRLIEAATDRGAQRVFLEVRADNPVAQGLYASAGFGVVGRRPRYYQPDGVDAIVMRLETAAGAAS
jgi:ribosomal-protein-alanine acetyltransferase